MAGVFKRGGRFLNTDETWCGVLIAVRCERRELLYLFDKF